MRNYTTPRKSSHVCSIHSDQISRLRHCGLTSELSYRCRIHLPASLRSTGITRFRRYYGRSDSCPAGSSAALARLSCTCMNTILNRTGLPASCVWPSDHSISNHLIAPLIAFTRYPSASETSDLRRSGLRHFVAGSPDNPAESSSLSLRTDRSPPVASHPLSPRRSYFQIQAGERLPEEDFHLSDQPHSQAHYDGNIFPVERLSCHSVS